MKKIHIFIYFALLSVLGLSACSSTNTSPKAINSKENNITYTTLNLESGGNEATDTGFKVDKRTGCLYVGQWETTSSYLSPVIGSNGHVVGCKDDPNAQSVKEYLNLK